MHETASILTHALAMLDPHATKYPNATVLSPYDATLNQTDIATNKNKFYIMQVLSHGNDYSLYTRYGRIGEVGVISYSTSPKDLAIEKFKTTFKSKTKNSWIDAFGTPTLTAGNDVSKFTKYGDKYFLCQKSLAPSVATATTTATAATAASATATSVTTTATAATAATTATVSTAATSVTTASISATTTATSVTTAATTAATTSTTVTVTPVKPIRPIIKPLITLKPKVTLDRRIVEFLELVGNMKMLNTSLKSMDIDTEKMPLGMLSQEQLAKADSILDEIKTLLNNGVKKDDRIFLTKSSEYYTLVPIVVGRSSRPPIINTNEIIGKYSDRIDELKNLKVAYTAVNNSANKDQEAQYENLYKSMKTTITPIDKSSDRWKIIEDYVSKTHGDTHRQTSNVEVVNVYEISRESDQARNLDLEFPNLKGIENLQLLWHGTRLANYISILQNGLVLRPELISNAHITGSMFGGGIYAANSFSKSLNYCAFQNTNNDACLFLGEFVLGKPLELTQSDSSLNLKKVNQSGCHSTWGRGKATPSSYASIPSIFDSSRTVKVPNGTLINSGVPHSSLLYDEFIVYNEKQLRLRYIVQIKVR